MRLKFWAPLIVLEKKIVPFDRLVSKEVGATRFKEVLLVIPPVVAITEPPKFKVPTPKLVTVTDPAVMGLTADPAIVPVKLTIKGPPFVNVSPPFRKTLFTFKVTPAAPFVLRSPFRVTAPPVSVTATEAALNAATVRLVQLLTVKAPIRVVPPIAKAVEILPVPAVIVKFCAPSTVLLNVISPAPAPEFKTKGPLKVIGPEKEIGWLLVVIEPL